MKYLSHLFFFFLISISTAQDYFYEQFAPYDSDIPSPAEFLGYDIGDYHTRHDRIVSYFEKLASLTDKASLIDYGKTHELRRLVILQISTAAHLQEIENHRQKQLEIVNSNTNFKIEDYKNHPIFVNLGYNVHGNEPSSSEAAMLSAYVLIASQHPDIVNYRNKSIVFIDPCINPDGRDRHTQWANAMRGTPLVDDPMDAEHNEMWPRGRTNHYWFDLNRDWLLAVHPESQGKLEWYHNWYPNVVTDFHEMGSNSSYFFEPMKANASKDPIMPVENYTTLNDTFAKYYQREMDRLGSLYFTKEVFDGTYPGYGSSYPDLQGGLGILFEQASSRGHVQTTPFGKITFPYTIRHQFVNSIATVEAGVKHKDLLQTYQHDFFTSALSNAKNNKLNAYVFGEDHDPNRLKAFLQMLLRHKIDVYHLDDDTSINGTDFNSNSSDVVPTYQPQYRMVQTMFETYSEYTDSVYYDASAWSLANAYNITYEGSNKVIARGQQVNVSDLAPIAIDVKQSDYAYIISWSDYNAPAVLEHLQSNDVNVMVSQKPFSIATDKGNTSFSYGSLVIPLQLQSLAKDKVHSIIQVAANKWQVEVKSLNTGYSSSGIDLGSRHISPLKKKKVAMIIGDGVGGYDAGFIWHLLDQRVNKPITKIRSSRFSGVDLSKYNTLVLASGRYGTLDSTDVQKIHNWARQGNTLITMGRATEWAIKKKLVKAALLPIKSSAKDSGSHHRHSYVDAREINGKNAIGGAIFEIDLDITHPIGYGYHENKLPIYRNTSVWLKPSKNTFSNVALYSQDPHIDGFITPKNLDHLKKTASIMTAPMGRGRAILFVDDVNFRGSWYGTNKLFLNALFFGDIVRIPSPADQGGHIHEE